MPDTTTSLQGKNEQGKTVMDHGRQYFILGQNKIPISEHFAVGGKPLDALLEAAIRHAAKRSGD